MRFDILDWELRGCRVREVVYTYGVVGAVCTLPLLFGGCLLLVGTLEEALCDVGR